MSDQEPTVEQKLTAVEKELARLLTVMDQHAAFAREVRARLAKTGLGSMEGDTAEATWFLLQLASMVFDYYKEMRPVLGDLKAQLEELQVLAEKAARGQ